MMERTHPQAAVQARGFKEPLDDAIAARAATGDVDAFRRLFERYGDRVHRYAYARIGRSPDAQRVVQDIFLATWHGLPRFRPDHPASFPGWLFGTARRVLDRHLRTAIRHPWVPLEAAPESPVEFEGRLLSQHVLANALEELSDSQREVVILRFVVGLTGAEVGAAIRKGEGQVESLQVQALERLRETIGRKR